VAHAHVIVRKDSYYDSVMLLRISRDVKAHKGVEDAVVAMGTPANRELLEKSGYVGAALAAATANDLVIAVRVDGVPPSAIEAVVDKLLDARASSAAPVDETRVTSLVAAVRAEPRCNLVLISVPGEHATREARRALGLGRHVLLFSDNVSLEDEVALKQEAVAKGLLMMGPDCGTAIINGVPLAFANVVRRGSIGIVGAAGTGIQEVSACIHRLGGGVSQAIGTGGRDLCVGVGGLMMLLGIEALAADAATEVLVVVSKPPAAQVADTIIAAVRAAGKPAVVHFVGSASRPPIDKVVFADSLAGTAEEACRLAGRKPTPSGPAFDDALVAELARRLKAGQTLCGLFCGGTTGYEALALLDRAGLRVRSNLHKALDLSIDGTAVVSGHVLLDLGDDAFTAGRPHPMIEPELRNERLAQELARREVGVLLFDVVLGYGSHCDPAGVLVRGVRAAMRGRPLVAIASVTGTDGDPQGYEAQQRLLNEAGVVVMPDNRRAAELAAAVVGALGKDVQ